jgi:hypothetical protein
LCPNVNNNNGFGLTEIKDSIGIVVKMKRLRINYVLPQWKTFSGFGAFYGYI